MPTLYFLTFEAIVLVMFALCLRHAWRAGPAQVWSLLAGVLFGLLLELATIRQLDAYRYGRFTIMVLDVPLMIGVAWGAIIYSARLFSDATSLPEFARPALDGLLGLNIDLAMDAVAIRLGMWDWGMGFEAQYFGVPYANFWAWFWVIFFFSAGLRLMRGRGRLGEWLAPAAGLIVGLAGVLFTNALITFWVPRGLYEVTVAAALGAALLLVLALRPRRPRPAPAPASQIPLIAHGYFLAAGLISGALWQPACLLIVSLAMLGLSIAIHRPALRART